MSYFWLFASITFLASSCAKPGTAQLVLTQSATLRDSEQASKPIKANEPIELTSQPIIIEKEGHISLMVYPMADKEARSTMTASLVKIEDWGGPSYQKKLQQDIQVALDSINEVQILLGQKKTTNALEKIVDLEKKLPIIAIKLLKANCYVLLGDQPRAVEVINDILKESPEHKIAKQMLNQIQGKRVQQ